MSWEGVEHRTDWEQARKSQQNLGHIGDAYKSSIMKLEANREGKAGQNEGPAKNRLLARGGR